MMCGLSRLLTAKTQSAKEAKKIAAQELLAMEQAAKPGNFEEGKEGHKRRLHAIRERAGNMLLLCPSLLNNFNKFNCRVLLLGARAFWTEQSILGEAKTTPVAEKAHTLQLCTGRGEKLLKEVWRGVTHDAGELSRLGLETLPGVQPAVVEPEIDIDSGVLQPGVVTADIPCRLMSFVCHMLEARFWSYATYQWSWPRAFLALLAEEAPAEEAMATARRQWMACILAEARGHQSPGLQELLAQQHWQGQPLVQLGFRLLAHCGFRRGPSLATTLFERLATPTNFCGRRRLRGKAGIKSRKCGSTTSSQSVAHPWNSGACQWCRLGSMQTMMIVVLLRRSHCTLGPACSASGWRASTVPGDAKMSCAPPSHTHTHPLLDSGRP